MDANENQTLYDERASERERKRERARNKMSVDYLFIERAHIGTHGHMLACTAHRFVHTLAEIRVKTRGARVRVLARVSLGSGRKVRFERPFILYSVYLLTRTPLSLFAEIIR